MNDDCLKLTTYFGERDRTDDAFVADALLDVYGRREIAISVLLRGAAGFGVKHHLRTDRLLTLSEDLPLVSVAVDTSERIQAALDEVQRLKRRGLLTLERARMLRDGVRATTLPEELHEATKLTAYVGRQDEVYGTPAYMAIWTSSTDAGSPAPPFCSASTAPPTASASAPDSSAAMPTSR